MTHYFEGDVNDMMVNSTSFLNIFSILEFGTEILLHTVSSQDFRSLSVFLILLSKFVDVLMTLGKNSLNSESLEVKVAISRKKFLKKFRKKIFLSKFCFIFF